MLIPLHQHPWTVSLGAARGILSPIGNNWQGTYMTIPLLKHKRIVTMNDPDLNIAGVILAVAMTDDAILLAASQSLIWIQTKNHFDDLDFTWGGITIMVRPCSYALDSMNG
jgi:hypothetical protein